MALSLWDSQDGEILATTSGSSDSWKDELADGLRGKRVILMPDDGEAGARYADSIVTSLDQRGIEHRIARFGDVVAKDVSQFMTDGHSKEELVERMGPDWVAISDMGAVERPTEFERA
jgi:hypothetical protein